MVVVGTAALYAIGTIATEAVSVGGHDGAVAAASKPSIFGSRRSLTSATGSSTTAH